MRVGLALGSVALLAIGFGAGALASAYRTRAALAAPWERLEVSARGRTGEPLELVVSFASDAVALSQLWLTTDARHTPTSARIADREGARVEVTYDDQGRVATLSSGTAAAHLEYDGGRVNVRLLQDGAEVGSKRFWPSEQVAGHLAFGATSPPIGEPLERMLDAVVPAAHAQASLGSEPESVTVRRSYRVTLDISGQPPAALTRPPEVRASCAPHVCVAVPDAPLRAGANALAVTVSGTVPRAALGTVAVGDARARATQEREAAAAALPHLARVIAAGHVVAQACAKLERQLPVCLPGLRSESHAGAAAYALGRHALARSGAAVEARVAELEDEARAAQVLAGEVVLELCASAPGFSEACNRFAIQPFAGERLPPLAGTLALAPGLGKDIVASFVVTQSDGSDCTFSPSPRTEGRLTFRFDKPTGRLVAQGKGEGSGVRSGLTCSLGRANMNYAQTYTLSSAQPIDLQALASGGKIPLQMSGTMSGSGTYSFVGCQSSGGAAAACPGGKNDSYSYPIELTGTLDLGAGAGSGAIVVKNSPLVTRGSWKAPVPP